MATTKGGRFSGTGVVIDARAPMLAKEDARQEEVAAVRLYPQRGRFISGVAREYDDTFPPELNHLVRALRRLKIMFEAAD